MAKGWSVVPTVNDIKFARTKEEKKRSNKRFAKAIKNAEAAILKDPKQDLERLKKEGEQLYWKKREEEDRLIDAYNKKLLKSKTAIKEVKRIIKERANTEKKNSDKKVDEAAATTVEQTA